MRARLALLFALAFALGACAAASAADVVLVRGDYLAKQSAGEARSVRTFLDTVRQALSVAGVPCAVVGDADVENKGALAKYKLAIFPHNRLSDGELAAVEKFVARGGKIIVFYGLQNRLAQLLGIRPTGWVGGPEGRSMFVTIRFTDSAVVGLPASVHQGSWNINSFRPLAGQAEVIGWWYNSEGKNSGYAAVSLGKNGVFVGHVLTGGDVAAKARFLLALVGHFLPQVWQGAAQRAIERSGAIGRFASLDELEAFCRKRGRLAAVQQALSACRNLRAQAQQLFRNNRWAEAYLQAEEARNVLVQDYPKIYPPRAGEMRAVWIHSPFNVDDWDAACAHLAKCGFNAVIVNMCNAGIAYYPSKYLKTEERAARESDQILRVLKSCRKYGLELHVWRVDWRVINNPERLQKLRAEGKLAVSYTGEPGEWLCPSWPENQKHEIDTMLEIVRNYDVDGIHFDYIRFNNANYCYCDHCRKTFEQLIGRKVQNWPDDVRTGPLREQYLQFRRDCITAVVKEVAEKARAIKPWIKISAAVFSDWPRSRETIGQDAKLWVDRGYLDFVCPMNYTNDTSRLGALTEAQVAAVRGQVPLYVGIGAWRHPDVTTLADQIALARELGADGFVCFCYENPAVQQYLTLTGQGLTAGKTYMPHWAPKVTFELPPGPDAAHPTTYPAGTKIQAKVTLTTEAKHKRRATRATATLEHRSTTGEVLLRAGELVAAPLPATKTVSLAVPQGRSRLVLEGKLELEDGTTVPFIARSAVIIGQ